MRVNSSIIILGAGVGGLSAAIRLAFSGHRVTLVEKNPRVGGKLHVWEASHPKRPSDRPFRFDTGPSLLTLPFVFEQLFQFVGRDIHQYVSIDRLDPIARYHWADGTVFSASSDARAVEAEVRRISPGDVAGWRGFFERGRRIWDLSAELFLYHAPEQVLAGKVGKRDAGAQKPWSRGLDALALLTTPLRIGMFTKFNREVDRYIKHPKLRELLYQYATYSGASPFKAPATLAVIPHAEFGFGGWYVQGGMYNLARALEKLALELGVTIRTGCAVDQILIDPVAPVSRGARPARPGRKPALGIVQGVRLSTGEELKSDVVVANSDVVYTYRNLIDARYRKKYNDVTLHKLEPGGTGMCLLLGVEGTYPQLAHHTKFMPADYTSDLRAMFETKTIPQDPCIYVCATTRSDPTQAPDGCENLFVLCSAPALDEDGVVHQGNGSKRNQSIDWSVDGPRYRDQIVQALEHRWGLTDLSKRIVVERRITPVDLRDTYNANAGTIYGIGSNTLRNAFLRPPNRDRDVRGLYFAGGATHPGGGLPLVALSGKIVSEMVMEDAQTN